MRAVVFHRPKDIRVDQVDDPTLRDTRDAILRVTSTAICGSDLHIYNGVIPQLRPMVLGHEFMGVVEEVGRDVQNLKQGDRVVVPFPIACGRCWFCEHALPTHCSNSNPGHYGPEGGLLSQKGGALFGYTDLYGGYDGGQAEYVRVPYADYGPRKVPESLTDEQVLFLTDILPTAWSGLEWAQLRGGETVAVFGCGPVGLMTQKAAWLRGAGRVIGLDLVPYRLEMARRSANAETLHVEETDAVEALRDMTGGRGPDVCVDAVGMEVSRGLFKKVSNALHLQRGSISALELCMRAVRRGGTVVVLGVYATDYDNFPLGKMFDKQLTLRGGQAPVHNHVDKLMELVERHRIVADDIITHVLKLDQAPHAYDIFLRKEQGCVKVVLKP